MDPSISPMLADTASEADLMRLCDDPAWAAEQKIDGHRLLLQVGGGRIFPSSRSGLSLPVSAAVLAAFKPFAASDGLWVFDGEYLGGIYYIFDLVQTADDSVTPATTFEDRRDILELFWSKLDMSPCVQLLPSYRDILDKLVLVKQVKQEGGEGVIFRRLAAPYVGRRSRNLLKFKFRHDIDCVVLGLGRRKANMSLGLYDNDVLFEVAECTALAGDKERIQVGDVVQVRYLYASADHRLVQPTMPRIRHDKSPFDCTKDQLVYANKSVLDTNLNQPLRSEE